MWKRWIKSGPKHWLDYCVFGFVILTSIATGAAAIYTRSYWITAENQLAVMADTEKRQLRAYLHVGHGPIEVTDNSATVEVWISHSGQTPAYKLRLDAVIEVAHFLLQPTEKLGNPIGMGGVLRHEFATLYGSEPIKQKIAMPVNSAEAIRLQRESDPLRGGRQVFYLHGRVRYLDIFDREWPYDFCFSFDPTYNPQGSERGCEDYNRPT
ncbi:hypothetical protein [Bradyrhizobium sp. SZCCHNR1075]|uniref:hypothetical protein n=1 Tax=Bradyrhizobium sp. SZCCHNR1075 TaxID=3057362 RepID=UPI0028E3C480|nr:hypothetical protein [Bradyrhizobium sp. SZCCHNR1075]